MAGLHTYLFGGPGATGGVALTAYPTSDGSIRDYDGEHSCMLRGMSVSHTAPTIDTYVRARLSQQPAQDELEVSPTMTNDEELFGGPRAVEAWNCPARVGHDFDVKGISAGTDNFSVGIYAQYGAPIVPNILNRRIRRHIDRTTDVTQAWADIGSIDDLEPELTYGISGLRGIAESAACLGIRAVLPGHGLKPGVPCGAYVDFVKEFGCVAATISGVTSFDIQAWALADDKIDAEVDMIIMGNDSPYGGGNNTASRGYRGNSGIGGGIFSSLSNVLR